MVDLTLPDPSPAPQSSVDSGDAAARLVARVQAWQHRHPLARRLPAADVNGLGVIALPFGPAAAAGGKLQPLFHQPSLVPGLSHRALVEFAQQHAVKYRPGPADWPLREVERADASPDPAPQTRYLLTAAITEPIKPGAQPRRLLIAPESPAIWGPRPLSRRRVAEAVGVLALILLALVWGQRGRLPGGGATPAAASAALPASPASVRLAPSASGPASVAVAASVPASPVSVVQAPVATPASASPARSTPASAVARTLPVSAPASTPAMAPPAAVPASAARSASLPAKSPSSPAAIVASAPPPAASVALPTPPKLLPMPALRGTAASAAAAATSAPAPAASAAVSPAGPHFALVSLPSKKRAGAEETLARIHKLLGPAIGNLQAQIMPSPEGFVVTIWPLPTEADAEQLANVLARRGVPMKWLEF